MTKLHQEDKAEPLSITEEVEAEWKATGCEFSPPGYARAASISQLFGWRSGATLSEDVSGRLGGTGTASECEPRGKGI